MKQKIISGVLIEEDVEMSLPELAQACSVPTEYIQQLVEAGILDPIEVTSEQWSFDGTCLRRVKVSIRLQRDLEVNLPGVAVILELLESR